METMTVRGVPWAAHIMQVAYELGRSYRERGIRFNPYCNLSSQQISMQRVSALVGAFWNGWRELDDELAMEAS